jgi:hypothetical protein
MTIGKITGNRKYKLISHQIIIFALFSSLIGCTTTKTVPARLYNISNAEVIKANFEFSGRRHGEISFQLPSGEHFHGEYHTVKGGVTGWGILYNQVWGSSTGFISSGPIEYRGSAVMVSDKGTIINCEYTTNRSRWEPHGQGACSDNKNVIYKLMF